MGPAFNSNEFTSSVLIKRALTKDLPGLAKLSWGCVDVRDVAVAHVKAM